MKTYTVAQLARLTGVSVRALHHYDEIGLLKPAHIGQNRYRYYGPEELLRLQQILIHRELNIPLSAIGAFLDAPGFDRLAVLEDQRQRLAAEARRYAQLVRTIDRTIETLKGDRVMRDADLYKGISPAKQTEYETWLIERYGQPMRKSIAISQRAFARMTEAEKAAVGKEGQTVEQGLAEAMRLGIAADSTELDPLLGRFHDWVTIMWGRPCAPEAFAGLADLHLSQPDFVSRYEAIAAGFSDYHAAAMKAWAARRD
ncbi:MerR family transcriptional regulator [soil metagenome]